MKGTRLILNDAQVWLTLSNIIYDLYEQAIFPIHWNICAF